MDEPQELRVTEEQPGPDAEQTPVSPEEQEPKADFYSTDLYNSELFSSAFSTVSSSNVAWPQKNMVRCHFLFAY